MNNDKNDGNPVKPEAKFRSGSVEGTIWKNEVMIENVGKRPMYSFDIKRNYKDANDEWKSTHSFKKADSINIHVVLDAIIEYLFLHKDTENE